MLPSQALAGRGLIFGIDDDGLKWAADPAPFLSAYSDLGVRAVRITVGWQPGQRVVSASDAVAFERIAAVSTKVRVVLVIGGGRGAPPPLTATARNAYCGYVASVLHSYPAIHDVVIWNEANQPTFWRHPNPVAYEQLLARCWDVLHAAVPGVNVIAATGPHARIHGAIAPVAWYLRIGKTLRASGRKRRLFDTLGHNVYPDSPFELPGARHRGSSIDEGDYGKLMAVLREAFAGTAQPLPGRAGVSIWYLEDGYQTTVPATAASGYFGTENVRTLLTPAAQAAQLTASIRLAYCQPAVKAFFNFELVDDIQLAGWQSGLLYADWTQKPAYAAIRSTLAAIRAGTMHCH